MSFHSSGERLVRLQDIESGTAIFPMSCTTPARRRATTWSCESLRCSPKRGGILGQTFTMTVGVGIFPFNAPGKLNRTIRRAQAHRYGA